jgi:hypothetical protein
MSALTGPRNTRERNNSYLSEEQFTKTGVIFFHGQLVAVDATGYLVPAITSTTLKRFGRCNLSPERKLDTTALASGAKKAKIEFGCYCWNNSTAGDLCAQADVGNVCYAVDDQTVAKTDGGGTRSAAGRIMEIDANGGVWVEHVFA